MDVYPCTVDEESWTSEVSIGSLFGHLCSGNIFSHDSEMNLLKGEKGTTDTTKRRKGDSGSQDSLHCPSEKIVELVQVHDRNATTTQFTRSDKIQNSTPTDRNSRERSRKRSRASQKLIKESIQSPTRCVKLPIDTSSEYNSASWQRPDSSRESSAPRTTDLPDALMPLSTSNDTKSGFEGWLKSPRSGVKPVIGETANPTLQFTSKISTMSSTVTRKVNPNLKAPRLCAEPLSKTPSIRKEYHCRWQLCNKFFDILPKLRQHVIHDHQDHDITGRPSRYICLWARCSTLKTQDFHTRDSWKDHLDTTHHLQRSQMPWKRLSKEVRTSEMGLPEPRHQEFRPRSHGPNDEEDSQPDRPRSPTDTQVYPISLSSQETSASPTTSSSSLSKSLIVDDQALMSEYHHTYESQDSRLSLSTSAFESQLSHQTSPQDQGTNIGDHLSNAEIHAARTKHRKQAYRAAKGARGEGWRQMELVGSTGGHGELEMEL